MECVGNLDSYGKRKKRSAFNETRPHVMEVTVTTPMPTPSPDSGKTDGFHGKSRILTVERFLGKSRVPRSAKTLQERMREGRVLPEHVDLGLRLTVGEDVLNKPFLRSTHGDGHFPEVGAQTEPSPNAYFPSLAGYPGKQFVKPLLNPNPQL